MDDVTFDTVPFANRCVVYFFRVPLLAVGLHRLARVRDAS